VLGGGGFIGSHVVDVLLQQGRDVRVFEKVNLTTKGLPFDQSQVEWVEGDFLNERDLALAVQGCDIVFHMISTTLPKTSNENPLYDIETNVAGSVGLLEIARSCRTKKIVFLSSGGTVYGNPDLDSLSEDTPANPICAYGIGKLSVEKYLGMYYHLYGLDYCILRVSNPYGERQRFWAGQGAVNTFLYKALKGECIEIWGDGLVVRDYIYIGDVAKVMLQAAQYDGPFKVFNIGSGVGKTLNDIIVAIEGCLGKKLKTSYLPGRAFDVTRNVLDITRACSHLGWRVETSLEEGLQRTAVWIQQTFL